MISLPKGGYVPEFSERRPRRPSASPKETAVLRLSILPPENAAFDFFAISPDGRKLAFTAFSEREADTVGSSPGFARGKAFDWNGQRCLPILVARQPLYWFLRDPKQAQDY